MSGPHEHPSRHRRSTAFRAFLTRWFLANTLISGGLALLWLLLRSGTKPSRFAYPCQQAAVSTATLAFGAPVVATALTIRRGVVRALRHPYGIAAAALLLVMTTCLWGAFSRAGAAPAPSGEPSADYRAKVFHSFECPADLEGDRFPGLDNLISLMGREGLKFYQSEAVSPVAGAEGIVAANDVVVIKINYQWAERGGTNTDLLRGLIHRIVSHPDQFVGEVIVCENAQFNAVSNFDRASNNAENISQSPHDVVTHFQNLGFQVSHYDWTARRTTQVADYDAGDFNDGYVVQSYDAQLQGRLSYPKFQSESGLFISMRNGIWDNAAGTYDRTRLKFINVPVLKSHHAVYGATACVKHYMGVVTTSLSTNSHNAMANGLLGALIGEMRVADLNLLDAIWINANPNDGPWTAYDGATRRDELVASVDPVAADIWSVTNILIPAFEANGYGPPWPYPSADPADPASAFRHYLDNSLEYLLAAGIDATNDLNLIDAYSWNGAGDFNGDSAVDVDDYDAFEACFTGNGVPSSPECDAGDFDADGDIDCTDWQAFTGVWTNLGPPPEFEFCALAVPMANAAGSRYLTVTMPAESEPAALLLTGVEPSVSCVGAYVQEDGVLGATPVFLQDWSAVFVTGGEIVPDAAYKLQADYGSPGNPDLSAPVPLHTWAWGDADNNGTANFVDVLLVVMGFQGRWDQVTQAATDLYPCMPDGVVNFEDVLQAVWAFQGHGYEEAGCPLPCP